MSEVDLHHRLYTHAGDGGGQVQKLGDADAERVLSNSQLTRLDKLMASIRPPADGRAYAAARFGPFVCFIVSQSALDGRGRAGARTRARVARVPPKTAMLDVAALVEFDGEELDSTLPVAAWSTVNAERYGRDEIGSVIASFLASIPREETITAPAFDLRLIADAWSLLPISFQESISWSLDVPEGARVNVAFTAGASSAIPRNISALARRWVDWALDRPDDAKRLIETTRATSLRDFEEELDEAPMATPKSRPQPHKGTLDPHLTEFLNAQIKASEESIYDWLEQELANAGHVVAPHTRGPRAIPTNALLAVAGVVLVALATLTVFLWRSQKRIARLERQVVALANATGEPQSVATPAEDEPEAEPLPDPLKTPEDIAGAGWPERFQWVVENRQRDVAPLIVALARNASLTPAKARDLQRMVDLLMRNEILTATDRRSLRAHLFELVVAGARISSVKQKLQVGTASNDPGDAALQSEVVLRWIAGQR